MNPPERPTRYSKLTKRGSHVLSHYVMCEEYFHLRHLEGLWPRGVAFNPLFGSAWHKVLEIHYHRRALEHTAGKSLPAFPEEFRPGISMDPYEHALAAGNAVLGPLLQSEITADRYEYGCSLLRSMYLAYVDWFAIEDARDEQYFLEDDPTRPTIEVPFEMRLWGAYTFTGTIDRIIRRSGLLVVQEHKTTTPQGLKFLADQSRMDKQFTAYHLGCAAVTGIRPDHVELNAAPKGADPDFKRIPITRTPEELEAFAGDVAELLASIDHRVQLWEAGHPVRWLRTGAFNGSCVSYGSRCPYMSLCKSPGQPLSYFNLESLFHVEKPEERFDPDTYYSSGDAAEETT